LLVIEDGIYTLYALVSDDICGKYLADLALSSSKKYDGANIAEQYENVFRLALDNKN
jgi:hypothetical protein